MKHRNTVVLYLLISALALAAEVPHPRGYVCHRPQQPLTIDGRLDEPGWAGIPWTDEFLDIEGDSKPRPRFRTRAKMAWDDCCFYLAAELQEPHVWGTLTEHDSVIFHDNDFEVFIDPDGDNHNYYEFEINALNTGWDLFLPKPYRDRGKADNSWEIPGLKTAVHIAGTLNDPSDRDRGWSVEIAIPWKAFREHAPRAGEQWRVNFSRVEWEVVADGGRYTKVKGKREDNWVWSPQFAIDMHKPELWGYVQFSTAKPGAEQFRPDPQWQRRAALMQAYYAQREFHKANGRYATAEELGLRGLVIELTDEGFTARLDGLAVDQNSRIAAF